MMIYHGLTPEESFLPFEKLGKVLIPFRDAGEDSSNFECTVLDCLRGLHKAITLGWYNFRKFDHKEYEFNHKLENGDMNWIIPNKILAFSSPNSNRELGLPP
jgi:cell division cycle 14